MLGAIRVQPELGSTSYIIPFGDDWLLVRLLSQNDEGRFFWAPLTYDDSTKEHYKRYFDEQRVTPAPVTRELILASVIALKRVLTL